MPSHTFLPVSVFILIFLLVLVLKEEPDEPDAPTENGLIPGYLSLAALPRGRLVGLAVVTWRSWAKSRGKDGGVGAGVSG